MEKLHYELVDLYNRLDIEISVPNIINFEEIEKGATAIECCLPDIDVRKFKEVFNEVVKLIEKYNPNDKATLSSIHDSLMEGDDQLKSIINALLLGEDFSNVLDLEGFKNPSLVIFVLSHTIKPFLLAYARSMEGVFPKEKWKKHYCPICGDDPIFARLAKDENGKRYLICIMCETQWPFNRVKCPYCLEEDLDKLGYFRIEDNKEFDGYRVNYCLSCNKYIKTYDEKGRITKKTNYYLENIKTASLDYLANKEGFKE